MGGTVLVKAGLKQSKFGLLKKGNTPKSIDSLEKGKTAVIFVTGISYQKDAPIVGRYGKDFTYVNEKRILKKQEILEEVKLANAEAVILTGADPLTKIDRCVSFTEMLKKQFGSQFHVTLSCPLKLITPQRLERLFGSGLDELQVRPDFKEKADWSKMRYLAKYAEVVLDLEAFPGKEAECKKLLDHAQGKIKYVIIKELEKKDYNTSLLAHLKTKKDSSIVEGSENLARALLQYANKKNFSACYIPVSLYQEVHEQRMKVKAKSIAKKYAKVTIKGTIKHGVIYLPDIMPCAEYQLKLGMINKKNVIKKLFRIKRDLQRELNIQFDMVDVDEQKLRLTTDALLVQHHASFLKNMKLQPALVEEYPTHNAAELKVQLL
ncbi:hypothetical protein J4410_01590 [Candidatus Woesearchaeota archaeon]|nr:hypothetical protein [Candidatus Woesearchaeota archaeon]